MAENDGSQSTAHSEMVPDTLPVKFEAPGVIGALGKIVNGKLIGWLYSIERPEPLGLSLFEGDRCLATVAATQWREDLAKIRGGNGHCGFELPIPEALCDGRLHEVDFRIAGDGQSLVPRPVRLLPGRRPKEKVVANTLPVASADDERKTTSVKLSIVVTFYNMHREAARTLTSLSRSYQRGIGDLAYEVLCVDNGSNPPLDPNWIASFGPEFRLFTPSKLLPSPCFAINEAARAARGEYLAVMIDGAHLLTPGVFNEAMAAFAESPGAIVALRHWFVGGDQRWLATAGYTREMEDKIFERINWPTDGYQLFGVSSPIGESPSSWLDNLVESNCLFLPAAHYRRIGGIDEDFSEPGAGFANLDLMKRAAAASDDAVICLIGEATFHQFHDGTTTNVNDEEKDARVRIYANHYRELRGGDFESLPRQQIRFRGGIKSDDTVRPLKAASVPLSLSVTERIRPRRVYHHLSLGTHYVMQSAYVESGLHRLANWRGAPVGVAPSDLLNLEEIIHQGRPDCIVTTSTDIGMIRFLNDVLQLFDCSETKIVRVALTPPRGPVPARVRTIVGQHDAPETLARIEAQIASCETVLVLYEPAPGVFHPLQTLHAYAQFVSFRSYLVFLGTVLGQPWLGYSKHWYMMNIRKFVLSSSFRVEAFWDLHPLSICASGYLRRVENTAKYAASLDDLTAFEIAAS